MTKNILLYISNIFTKSQHGKKGADSALARRNSRSPPRRPSSGDGKAPVRAEYKIDENRRHDGDPYTNELKALPDDNP